jgi:hypothetical protein
LTDKIVARFLFFLLMVANTALAAHLWMEHQKPAAGPPLRELAPDSLRIIGVVDGVAAAQEMERFAQLQRSLAASPCAELSGVGVVGSAKARELIGALDIAARVSERRIEEVTKYSVFMPPSTTRRVLEEAVAQLKAKNVKDYQVLGDNSISLGVFATEEAASRHLADMEKKGVKGARVGGRSRELKDIVFVVKQPDVDLAGRLLMLARDLPGGKWAGAACAAEAGVAQG